MPTEQEVEAGAAAIAASPLIDAPKLPAPSWHGLSRAVLEAAERAAHDGLPPGYHYAETHTLLEEINAAAHTRGTNAWLRNLLHRAYRAIAKTQPPA